MAELKAYKLIPYCTKDTVTYEMTELILCENCKYFIKEGHYCKAHGFGRKVRTNDFCPDGEPKEGR
jgi:ribosomal protein L37AE/L43A